MDHLELPPNSASQHIPVPDYCTEPYDGGEFTTYPQRVGWEQHKFHTVGFWKHKNLQQTTAFLQAWLFFGMMEAMFDLKVEISDFVYQAEGGKDYVTTRNLRAYIQRWWRKMQTGGPEYLHGRVKRMEDIIRISSRTANNFDDPSHHLVPASLDPAVALSIKLLGRTLAHVCDEFVQNKFTSLPGRLAVDTLFQGSQLVVERAVAAGWCQNQIARFARLDAQYYASSIDRHWRGRSHDGCSAQRCIQDNIAEGSYERAHWNCPQRDSCREMEFPAELTRGILYAGGIPVLALDICPPLDVVCGVVDAREILAHNQEYAAISHIWSDGLGNPSSNGVQICQLLHLYILGCSEDQRKLFYSEGRMEAGKIVFIWLDTCCVPREREYRNIAIQRMAETYKLAKRTLVLDEELQETCSVEMNFPELCARIRGSRWMSRVWTFQEAILSQDLRIFLEDGELEFDQLKRAEEELYSRNRLDPLSFECSSILPLRTAQVHEEPRRFIHAWNGFSTRSTSHRGDEVLCLASVLGKDTSPVVGQSPGEYRLIALAAQFDKIPTALLFAPGPHSERSGYSWIPLSLFGYEGQPVLWDFTVGVDEAVRTEKGLVLPRPGILFDCHALSNEETNLNSNVYVFCLSDCWYFVHPYVNSWTASSWVPIGETQSTRCGVIFRKIEWEMPTRSSVVEVAIVCVQGSEDAGVIQCSFKGLGSVVPLSALGVEQPLELHQSNQSNGLGKCHLDSSRSAMHWISEATVVDQMQMWRVG